MRKKLSLMLYLLLVEAVACYLVVVPAYAFQISSSTTGYVRVIPSSGATSMLAASRASHLATIASAASSASGQALAIRLVAGSSFIGLGVLAGLMLYELYYSSSELAQIKSEASAGAFTPVAGKVATTTTCPGSVYCSGSVDAVSIVGVGPFEGCPVSTVPSWPLFARDFPPPFTGALCIYRHSAGQPNALGTVAPTAAQISAWVDQYAATHPLSLETNTQPVGVGVSSQSAGEVLTQPIESTAVTTQVIPATQVGPTDVVVNPNATPTEPVPTAPTQQTSTNTSTTTTMTTMNPDGSTTTTATSTQVDDVPAGSCGVGNHDPRTFGGILQSHIDTWRGSGLLSALNLLGTLVWPTTSPTYTLTSTVLGSFTFDFTAWSGMLLAIRSVIIAIAGFVAYKIIFVGSRA